MGKSDPAVKDTGALFMEELGVFLFIPLLVSGHRLCNPHQRHGHPGPQRMGVVVLVAGMDDPYLYMFKVPGGPGSPFYALPRQSCTLPEWKRDPSISTVLSSASSMPVIFIFIFSELYLW
jgi:hypothetical protein